MEDIISLSEKPIKAPKRVAHKAKAKAKIKSQINLEYQKNQEN